MPAPCCGYVFFSFMAPVAQSNLAAASTHCSIRPWHVLRASSCCALRRLAPRWVTSCWPLSMGKPTTPGSRWTTQSAGWSVADTELTAQLHPILSGWHIQCSRLLCTPLEYKHFDSFRNHDYFDEFLLRAYQVANVVCFEYVSVPSLFGRRRQKKSIELMIYILWRVKPPRGMCFTF